MTFADLWAGLEPLGRDPRTGGYRRYSWTPADAQCRAWFTRQAEQRGLTVDPDATRGRIGCIRSARHRPIVLFGHRVSPFLHLREAGRPRRKPGRKLRARWLF